MKLGARTDVLSADLLINDWMMWLCIEGLRKRSNYIVTWQHTKDNYI